jgi:tellurite methyltransferase
LLLQASFQPLGHGLVYQNTRALKWAARWLDNLSMDLRGWDLRYRSSKDLEAEPTPLVLQAVGRLQPGKALDLACGSGRNALWLAEQGWSVTALDGAPAAIEILRRRAEERSLHLEARVADLEKGEYRIEPGAWDLITICCYLQRDLFEPAKQGLRPGGVLAAIVHIAELGEEPTYKRLRPGELRGYFLDCEILHHHEGKAHDPSHRRSVAEIVAQRQGSSA